jgi:nucleoside-diphosphate-sugar epimerase
MKILIIGGTGLISTPITRTLAERGADLTVFNRAQHQPNLPAGVEQIVGSRTDYAQFETQMHEAGPFDCVIDMVNFAPEDAHSSLRAFAGRIGQFILCSTVDVYSKPPLHYPIVDTTPRGPAPWDYAQHKAEIEEILEAGSAQGNFPLTILRPAHTYHDGGWLIHSLGASTTYLDRLRKGKPIVVHGDGSSLWCSCHAEDVARAFVEAIGNPKALGKAYHLPGEEWFTWNDYHHVVAAALGAPTPTLVHIPSDLLAAAAPKQAGICAVNFQYNNIFDTQAARTDLNFHYAIPFREGARRVVAYQDAQGLIADSDLDPLPDRLIAAWQHLSERLIEDLNGS